MVHQGLIQDASTAVILIDLYDKNRNSLVCPLAGNDKDGLFDDITRLLDYSEQNAWPVVITKYESMFSRTLREIRLHHAFDSAVKIDKPEVDAFEGTDLGGFLSSHGIRFLIIGGYSLPECISATARTALEKGYGTMTAQTILFVDALQIADLSWVEQDFGFSKTFKNVDDLVQQSMLH